MIVQIECNDRGEIKSVAGPRLISLAHGARAMMGRIPSPGHTIVEIEVAEVQHDRDFDGMQKVKKYYRVTDHPDRPRLVAR
jgi:hypothetical protein